jgi:hypothetical protein
MGRGSGYAQASQGQLLFGPRRVGPGLGNEHRLQQRWAQGCPRWWSENEDWPQTEAGRAAALLLGARQTGTCYSAHQLALMSGVDSNTMLETLETLAEQGFAENTYPFLARGIQTVRWKSTALADHWYQAEIAGIDLEPDWPEFASWLSHQDGRITARDCCEDLGVDRFRATRWFDAASRRQLIFGAGDPLADPATPFMR